MNEYYECRNCGQVVQGWNASLDIECCDRKDMIRVYDGPAWNEKTEDEDEDESEEH